MLQLEEGENYHGLLSSGHGTAIVFFNSCDYLHNISRQLVVAEEIDILFSVVAKESCLSSYLETYFESHCVTKETYK